MDVFSGILLSPDIQVSCVPLLLHWISKGTNEQIPNGLQALSTAIDNNKEARYVVLFDTGLILQSIH